MRQRSYPAGWNEARVRRVLEHYERQSKEEAVAEDEAAFRDRGQMVMVVPRGLVPQITRLIERQRAARRSRSKGADKRNGLVGRRSRRG